MTSSVAEKPAEPTPERDSAAPNLTHRQIVVILSGLMTGMFLAALDQTIVGTSIRTIADDLNGLSLQAWITTAYLITATISTPIYGKLSDIYGRKPLYLTAITIFVLGSAAGAFAQSMYQLAAFRAVQGLGAGGLMSLALTILGDLVPPRQRAKYQAYFLAVFGTSTVLGPVLGGFFAGMDSLLTLHGWRWVFLVNVPLGAVALFVVARVLNVPHERQNHRIDWWGGLFLATCLIPLLLIAEQGRDWGWTSSGALICYAIGAIGLVLFLFTETRMKDAALIPLRLFRNSTFSVAILGGVIVGVAMFGSIMLIPQYLQIVQGYTPTESGLLMLPLMLGIMSGSVICGRLTARTGRYKVFPLVGTVLMSAGMLLFAQVEWDSPIWQPLLFMLTIGLGLGGCMQTLIIAVQNAGPRRDMGVSTAAATFFRQMGGTIGVAVFLSILFSTLTDNIARAFASLGVSPAAVNAGGGNNIMEDSSFLNTMPVEQAKPFFIGFTDSISTVFYLGSAVALLAFVVLLFMREIPLADSAPAAAPVEGGEALLDEDDGEDGDPGAGQQAGPGRHRAAPGPITGHVRRQDGTPVDGAALTLIDQHGKQVSRGTGHPDGSYTVDTPGPGNYVLIVSADGHQPQASSVVAGEEVTTLDVTLTGSGELAGIVRTAGEPVVGATVTLTDARGEVTGACRTEPGGGYAFRGVDSGAYTLVASGDGLRPEAVSLVVPDSGVLRQDLELTAAVRLSGVARTEGDRVVPDARITVLDSGGEVAAVARTDAAGNYLVTDLPPGEYTVVASGYPPATSQVSLHGGDAAHDVRLGYERVIDELAEHS
ncbi:MFS transporter [Amycolatopsis aidingensis]|uniref:MFS transporter n=1 Tax=Amycolatopsis aidingensis TaxID=2842453 RepID=UPI001C0B985B|nr:MFS transporter [Amycolatopsis aidingensis]